MQTSQQLMTEYGNEREMMRGALMKIARATTMVSAAQPLALNTFRGVQPGSGPVSASVRPVTNRGGLTVASDAHATVRPDSYAPVSSSELIRSAPAGSAAGPRTVSSPQSPGALRKADPQVSVRAPSSDSGIPTRVPQSPHMNPESMVMPEARHRAYAFQYARNNGIDVEKHIPLGEVQRVNTARPPMSGEASVIGKVVNAPSSPRTLSDSEVASAVPSTVSSRRPAPASSYGSPAPSWDPRSVKDPVSRAPTSAAPSTVSDPTLQPTVRPARTAPTPVSPTVTDPGQLTPAATAPIGQVQPVGNATVQRFMGGAQPEPMAAGPVDPGQRPHAPGQPQLNPTGRVGQAAPAAQAAQPAVGQLASPAQQASPQQPGQLAPPVQAAAAPVQGSNQNSAEAAVQAMHAAVAGGQYPGTGPLTRAGVGLMDAHQQGHIGPSTLRTGMEGLGALRGVSEVVAPGAYDAARPAGGPTAGKPGQVAPASGAAGSVGQVGAPPSSGPATTVSGPPSGVLAPASTAKPSAGQLNPAVQQAAALGNIPVASAEQQANAKAMGQAQALKNIPAQHQETVKNIANDQTKTPEQKTSLLQDTLGLSPGAAAALLVLLAGGYVAGKGMEMTGRVIGGAAAGFGGGHGGPAFYGSGMAAVPY